MEEHAKRALESWVAVHVEIEPWRGGIASYAALSGLDAVPWLILGFRCAPP